MSIANKTLEYWILHTLSREDCARGADILARAILEADRSL